MRFLNNISGLHTDSSSATRWSPPDMWSMTEISQREMAVGETGDMRVGIDESLFMRMNEYQVKKIIVFKIEVGEGRLKMEVGLDGRMVKHRRGDAISQNGDAISQHIDAISQQKDAIS